MSIISEALAQRLRLPRTRTSMTILGIGGAHSGAARGKIILSLFSGVTGVSLPVAVYVLPHLSSYSGPMVRATTTWSHIRGLLLADPRYFDQDPIELLLGADACSAIFEEGLRKSRPDELIAQKTSLGWILFGGCRAASPHDPPSSHHCSVDQELMQQF